MPTPSTPVLEIAVYSVHAPNAFPAIQLRTHDALATFRGYRAGLRLRAANDGVFADLVAWDSLEAAQQASNAVREDPRFAALMTSIEALRLYAHYRVAVDLVELLAELRRAPAVEVAAYAVREVADHLEVHGRVHEALRAQAGHRGGAPARQVEAPGEFADLVGWDGADAQQLAGAALQERAELAPFFSGMGEMKVFELFSVLG
jgi:hypothetical protein